MDAALKARAISRLRPRLVAKHGEVAGPVVDDFAAAIDAEVQAVWLEEIRASADRQRQQQTGERA